MPHTKSAAKNLRHTERRRIINRLNKGKIRAQVKKFRLALVENNIEKLKGMFTETLSTIDKSVQSKIIHKNTASRLKSRLTKHYNKATKPSA